MADPIIPSAASLVTAAIDAIVAARPSTLTAFNTPGSVYSGLPAMWRAQALLLLSRLSDEVKSARLGFAQGDALRTLAASEFNTALPPDPQPAYAQINLSRPGSPGLQGTFPAGTTFTKQADPNAVPLPIQAAQYKSLQAVYVGTGVLSTVINCVATAPGSAGNLPYFGNYTNPTSIALSTPVWDSGWFTTNSQASGGSDGLPDPVLIAAAKAYATGQFGPTQGAIIAGILQQQSVRHLAVFPASNVFPYTSCYIADQNWASSVNWVALVAQAFVDTWQGFGGRVRFGTVFNTDIVVAPTIVLTSTDALNYTAEIDANVNAVVQAYFNDRTDWYRWRAGTLRALLSKADTRILQCTAVSVTDAVTGAPIPEPPYIPSSQFGYNPAIGHYYPTGSTQSTYQPPL